MFEDVRKSSTVLRDCVSLLVFACALFLVLALISHSPYDNSWFYYSSAPQPTKNVGGVVGAYASALLLYLFGSSALLLAFFLIFIAYLVIADISYKQEWERLTAWVILLFTSSALCALYRIDFLGTQSAGGILGAAVSKKMLYVVGPVGGIVFLHMLLFISLILLTRFSFIGVSRCVVRGVRALCNKKVMSFIYRITHTLVRVIIKPFVVMACFIKKLYHGAVVPDEQYAVADFERDLRDAVTYSAQEVLFVGSSRDETAQRVYATGAVAAEQSVSHPTPKETEKSDVSRHSMPGAVASLEHAVSRSTPSHVYRLPQESIFGSTRTQAHDARVSKELESRAKVLEEKLERFGVYGSVTSIKAGPVVTLFEYQPDIDTKVSKIIALEDDLALALQAMSIRIIAPIPGRSVVGFEVANKQRQDVMLASVISSSAYKDFKGGLPVILGQDTLGSHVVVDLARMPHLLVAGSTGSGKSVALNAMLISLLCARKPNELRLILIDPKRLEFAGYADIPHLLFPIITDAKRATLSLRWVVQEMDKRYQAMASCGARNIFDYNALVGVHEKVTHTLPYIVVVIDELADLMMTASREIEDLIARIAQMARAAGIHMVVATQRPSVDVITGLIKVNFPSRIAFRVTSKIDSRTILDAVGADKLLGRGDMLFLDAGGSVMRRVHGAYVSDKEISDVVKHIRAEQKVEYLDLQDVVATGTVGGMGDIDENLYQDVIAFIQGVDEVSISLLQRKFRIGFNRSARIIEQLESQGLIMSSDGGKTRKVIH